MNDADDNACVEARDFSTGYRRQPVFDAVDIAIPTGTVALLGPNGAGKSTLMRSIVGLKRRYAGQLSVLGLDRSAAASAAPLAREVGYLSQAPEFDPWMRTAEHVAYCGWLKGMSGQDLSEATRDVLERVGLEQHARRRMGQLSGGMLRRAAIAAALVSSPKLLVLDEPTAGLDPAQRAAFKSMIADVGKSASVLMSTHLVEDVANICEYTIVIVGGSVAYSGRTAAFGQPESGRPLADQLERAYLAVSDGATA